MTSDMYFNIYVDYSIGEIAVVGEFDVATACCLGTAVAGFQRAGIGNITIDLDGVTFIDAAGLDAVVSAQSVQTGRGSRLTVVGATGTVRNVFDKARLAGLLQPEAA